MCLGKVVSCITKVLLKLTSLMVLKTHYGKVSSFDEILVFVTCNNLYFVHAQNKYERVSCITAGLLLVRVNFVSSEEDNYSEWLEINLDYLLFSELSGWWISTFTLYKVKSTQWWEP